MHAHLHFEIESALAFARMAISRAERGDYKRAERSLESALATLIAVKQSSDWIIDAGVWCKIEDAVAVWDRAFSVLNAGRNACQSQTNAKDNVFTIPSTIERELSRR